MMRSGRSIVAGVILLLGFSGAWAQAVGTGTQEVILVPPHIEFPTVEGWELVAKGPIPGDSGVAANYDSSDGERMTVYVYDRGAHVPKDLTGIVKEEFEGAKEALLMVAEMGVYKNLKITKNDTTTVGGAGGKVKAVHAVITFEARGEKLNSEIYVFPYKGHIAKLRISRPATLPVDTKGYLAMMTALDAFFAK